MRQRDGKFAKDGANVLTQTKLSDNVMGTVQTN